MQDGTSLVPLLEGMEPAEERAIVWHYPVYHHDTPASAVRKGPWKLIHRLVDDRLELYNLEKDPGETSDLVSSNAAKAEELYELLETWRQDCGAEFPVPNPAFDPGRRHEWGIHPDRQ